MLPLLINYKINIIWARLGAGFTLRCDCQSCSYRRRKSAPLDSVLLTEALGNRVACWLHTARVGESTNFLKIKTWSIYLKQLLNFILRISQIFNAKCRRCNDHLHNFFPLSQRLLKIISSVKGIDNSPAQNCCP